MDSSPKFEYEYELVEFIEEKFDDDLMRIRALYYWLARNIAYDKSYKRYHAEETFRHRSGVCSGFSELFASLAYDLNLEARIITGYAKGDGYRPGKPLSSNHAWNLVLFQGEWLPLDVTWSSCLKDYKHYFLTDPEQFIFSHLPLDEESNGRRHEPKLNAANQLLKRLVSYKLWDCLPDLYPEHFYKRPNRYRISRYRKNILLQVRMLFR